MNHEMKMHPQRTVCGIAVDIYSIVIPDKYDPTAIPGTCQTTSLLWEIVQDRLHQYVDHVST